MAKFSVSVMPAFFSAQQQIEQRALFGVVGQRGIARRGTNAAIAFAQQIVGLRFSSLPKPHSIARALVHQFGERFGQAVGQRLGHEGVVVVVVLLKFRDQRFDAQPRGDRERAQIIQRAALPRRDEIRQRRSWAPGWLSPSAAAACGTSSSRWRDSSA